MKRKSPRMPGYRIEKMPGRPNPWRVRTLVYGQRRSRSYATEGEARAALSAAIRDRLENGPRDREFDARAHAEWHDARQTLGGLPVSLIEVAAFYRDHAKRDLPALPVAEGVAQYLAAKAEQGLSERHLRDMRCRCGALVAALGKRPVRELDGGVVLDWIRREGGAPRSQKNNRDAVLAFLAFAVRRGWTDKSPEVHESDLPKIKATTTGVLTVAQAEGVMRWVEAHRPEYAAWFAAQAFAGIRHAESERLTWEMMDFPRRRIILPADICKTGDDWVLHGLPDNLWAWLVRYRSEGRMVHPSSRPLDSIRKAMVAAGIIPAWPENALRHSFATYHISLYQSADKTALLTRHRSATMLFRHYLASMVEPDVAGRYFGINPLANVNK